MTPWSTQATIEVMLGARPCNGCFVVAPHAILKFSSRRFAKVCASCKREADVGPYRVRELRAAMAALRDGRQVPGSPYPRMTANPSGRKQLAEWDDQARESVDENRGKWSAHADVPEDLAIHILLVTDMASLVPDATFEQTLAFYRDHGDDLSTWHFSDAPPLRHAEHEELAALCDEALAAGARATLGDNRGNEFAGTDLYGLALREASVLARHVWASEDVEDHTLIDITAAACKRALEPESREDAVDAVLEMIGAYAAMYLYSIPDELIPEKLSRDDNSASTTTRTAFVPHAALELLTVEDRLQLSSEIFDQVDGVVDVRWHAAGADIEADTASAAEAARSYFHESALRSAHEKSVPS